MLAVTASAPARAGESEEGVRAKRLSSRQVISRLDQPDTETEGWFARHVSFARGNGLQYRQRWSVGDRKFEFRVRGPVFKVKKSKKKFGLQFEFRF